MSTLAPTPTDSRLRELIERVGTGDREAFAELYDLTSQALYGEVVRVSSDAHEAADLTRSVYLEVWASAPAFPSGATTPHEWMDAVLSQQVALVYPTPPLSS